MVKMIVTDMDGTLLNSQKQLPKNFSEIYSRLQELNIQFVVASGRQYYTLREEFEHIDHDMAFVAENGGFINWKDGVRLLNPIKTSGIEDIIRFIRQIDGANIVLCGKEGAYIERTTPEFMSEVSKYYQRNTVVEDLTKVEDDILKIAVNDFNNIETTTYDSISKFTNDFQVSTSSKIWLDIMPKGVNKGEAVEFLQKQFGVTPEETMVFGDYLNDYEMLEAASHSYAMANAHTDILQVANYQTKSNDENGVMLAIEEMLLK